MKALQRWKAGSCYQGNCWLDPSPDGEWVRWEDINELVESERDKWIRGELNRKDVLTRLARQIRGDE